MEISILDIRKKKLKDMTREELTINRTYTLELIHNTTNPQTRYRESKYLEKVDREIRKRNYAKR